MVREKSGKSQGILHYSNCGHPVNVYVRNVSARTFKSVSL